MALCPASTNCKKKQYYSPRDSLRELSSGKLIVTEQRLDPPPSEVEELFSLAARGIGKIPPRNSHKINLIRRTSRGARFGAEVNVRLFFSC